MASSPPWLQLVDEDRDFEAKFARGVALSSSKIASASGGLHGKLASLSGVKIDRKCISVKEKLGEGSFGTVYKGELSEDGLDIPVAIKTIKQDSMTEEKFLNEARTMHKLQHDNLVKLIGVCIDEESVMIVSEYMCNGDLCSFLQKDNGQTILIKEMIGFAFQIASGMDYLETKGFVHRDLRCENVLVGTNHLVKVADFGLARLVDDYDKYIGNKDTIYPYFWTAPESKQSKIFTIQSDVWSFGVLLHEMITYCADPAKDIKAVVENEKPEHWPINYYNIMKYCLEKKPDARPTFSALCTFISGYRKQL